MAETARSRGYGALAVGGLVTALGLGVLVGWHSGYPLLVEAHPLFAPISYAVAVGLIVAMTFLLALAVQLARTARGRALSLESEIADRRFAQEALRHSEAKYRSLIENLEHSVFLKDRDQRFVAANKHFCQSLDRSEEQIVGKTDYDFYPRALADRYRADDQLVLAEGKRLEAEVETPVGGKPRLVRLIRTPVKDRHGVVTGTLGVFWDVTEQRTLEAQLRQAQKMEAIGQLAGGIAHDFNNLLTVILGNVSLIAAHLPADAPDREVAAAAEQAALRAATLTKQMLGFSRQAFLRSQPTDLKGVMDEVVALLSRTIDPRITLSVDCSDDLWRVQADPGQMSQILMNLCLNSRDAMPDGGHLRLSGQNVELTVEDVRLRLDARAGAFVHLSVSDTGHGMTDEVRTRIFEPFFTTKDPGKGTGLGCAMVFGIVKQHHGWIHCSSNVNEGTRFDIYLPRFCQDPAIAKEPPMNPTPINGSETILLAEDEPLIRKLVQTVLTNYGYQVLAAEDGQEAVEIYQREQGHIDLVILDLTMPRLSGRDAFRQLRQMDPQVRVLFASGYSEERVNEDEQEYVLGFVAKPYRPDDLAKTVRAVLDKSKERMKRTAAVVSV